MSVSKVLNFVKPALGMPAMPPVQTRTTLIKIFNLDVDLGFFIFMILVPYKTHDFNSSLMSTLRFGHCNVLFPFL